MIVVGGLPVVAGYPVLPWTGVMALGFAAGRLYDMDPARRRRVLGRTGLALIAAFLVVRAVNAHGDPSPWAGSRDVFPAGLAHPLWAAYVAWMATVAPMLPLCHWYGRYRTVTQPRWGPWL